ncbi:hypothetical protein MYX06_04555 [Patescibacteria group bacterium AH-259-L05]|nr:hypothetical protein [Patescibacteria group bacterium AH-259-L05]
MKGLLVVVFGILFMFMTGCSDSNATPREEFSSRTSEGVILYGCDRTSSAWFENTNAHLVRIRRVIQSHNPGQGEHTKAIYRLEPGEKFTLDYISHDDGFYIYREDGVLVGWLDGDCPKN